MKIQLYIIAIIFSIFSLVSSQAADWPWQGGPDRDHMVPARELNMDWDAASAPIKWRANVGYGSSPVVVVDGRVYTYGSYHPGTTVDQLDDPERALTNDDLGKYDITHQQAIDLYPSLGEEGFLMGHQLNDPEKRKEMLENGRFRLAWEYVQCLDAATGNRLWATLISERTLLSDNHQQWARSSPAIADGGVFIHNSNGQLYRLDAVSGAIDWHVDLAEHGMTTFHDKEPNSCGPLYYDGKVIVQYNNRSMVVGAFDAATGTETWRYTSKYSSFRSHFSRLGFSHIHGKPTILVPDGWATTGLNPSNGEVRWDMDVFSESMEWKQQAFEEIKTAYEQGKTPDRDKPPSDAQITRGYAPYTSYSPVAWEDYVMDYRDYAHSDFISSTYCLKIGDSNSEIVWQTNKYVPEAYQGKSNMIAKNGRLYFFEFSDQSYIPRIVIARLGRPEGVGQFVCLDIPTGELLWSTDAFRSRPSAEDDFIDPRNGYKFILAGDALIATADNGLWLGTIGENGAEAKVAIAMDSSALSVPNLPAEPVLVDQTLFYRQTMPQEGEGILEKIGGTGNLICFDLQP